MVLVGPNDVPEYAGMDVVASMLSVLPPHWFLIAFRSW